MILFLDLEHKDLRETNFELAQKVSENRIRARKIFEELSGEKCLLLRYDRFDAKVLEQLQPSKVICSGHNTELGAYAPEDLEGVSWLLKTVPVPILTICGSYQLMAQLWGGSIGPMDTLPERIENQHPDGIAAFATHLSEQGYCSVQQSQPHPMWGDLPQNMLFFQNHYWEVKRAPDDFDVIAEGSTCAIQAIAHRQLPLVGCQFHPEVCDHEDDDGRLLLRAFFASE